MKKIGILTFHRAVNYGAVLQAYALKTFIENNYNDVSVEIIDYRSNFIESYYRKIFLHSDSLKTKVKKVFTYDIQKSRNILFDAFVIKYLNCSTFFDQKTIKNLNSYYDIFLVGSDQVWSPFCTNNDTTYFLDFVNDNSKKNTYAASLGVRNDNWFLNDNIKSLITSFKNISIREKSSVNLLKNYYGEKIDVCDSLDPTFLLNMSDWKKIIEKNKKYDNYILVYSLNASKPLIKYAKKLSKEKNKKLIVVTSNNLYIRFHFNKVVSPNDFISLFSNANYVITNSFHGTAFSIIFNKQFSVFLNDNKNIDNSRLVDLLNRYGLGNRIVTNKSIKKSNEIDYDSVNLILNDDIEKSKIYLDGVIK